MATHLVNCSTNALETAYAIACGMAIVANPLDTFMIFPFVSSKCGIASLVNSTGREKIEREIKVFDELLGIVFF